MWARSMVRAGIVFLAAGLLAAPVEHEASQAFPCPLGEAPLDGLSTALALLYGRCAELMAAERVPPDRVSVRHFADLCYIGQSYTLEVPLELDGASPLNRLYDDFIAAHDRVYGFALRNPARIVNLRSVHQAGGVEELGWAPPLPAGPLRRKGSRRILLCGQASPVEAAVYDRAALPGDLSIGGPAVIEQADTTILIEPGWRAVMAPHGNLLLTEI